MFSTLMAACTVLLHKHRLLKCPQTWWWWSEYFTVNLAGSSWWGGSVLSSACCTGTGLWPWSSRSSLPPTLTISVTHRYWYTFNRTIQEVSEKSHQYTISAESYNKRRRSCAPSGQNHLRLRFKHQRPGREKTTARFNLSPFTWNTNVSSLISPIVRTLFCLVGIWKQKLRGNSEAEEEVYVVTKLWCKNWTELSVMPLVMIHDWLKSPYTISEICFSARLLWRLDLLRAHHDSYPCLSDCCRVLS